jgi:hypothetical protein
MIMYLSICGQVMRKKFEKNIFFASLKSMMKEIGSGV